MKLSDTFLTYFTFKTATFKMFKAGALCKNVISVAFSSELKEELKGKKFSILIDETTDTSTAKLLAVLVRHWDSKICKMVDDLLGLVEVVDTTGQALFDAVAGKKLSCVLVTFGRSRIA